MQRLGSVTWQSSETDPNIVALNGVSFGNGRTKSGDPLVLCWGHLSSSPFQHHPAAALGPLTTTHLYRNRGFVEGPFSPIMSQARSTNSFIWRFS